MNVPPTNKGRILAHPPLLMGIVNVTPDSFSDGGAYLDPGHAIEKGIALAEEGAAVLDIGAESTRPGAETVPEAEELKRALPVVKGLAAAVSTPISIDTRKSAVARACADAGASIWNDVSALTFDSDSLATAAALGGKIVLMHAQGEPATMQNDPSYENVVEEVFAFLAGRIEACKGAGIDPTRLIVDPGVGFGKRLEHNLALIANLRRFSDLGAPVLVGASRKRFIAQLDAKGRDGEEPETRIGGSIAAAVAAAQNGAQILRVHDVAATRQALAVWRALADAPLA